MQLLRHTDVQRRPLFMAINAGTPAGRIGPALAFIQGMGVIDFIRRRRERVVDLR